METTGVVVHTATHANTDGPCSRQRRDDGHATIIEDAPQRTDRFEFDQ